MSKKIANPYDKVTSHEVYEGLTSINYLEKTHKEMLTNLKNTKPYKALMQMADDTYLNPSNVFPDVQSTKEKIKEVGSLVLDLDYCISNALVKAVNLESKCVVETFIKRVSNMKQIETEPSPSPKKGKKRPACSATLMKSQDSSDAKQIKVESDSSVHTSDLSSFEDETLVSNEDQTDDMESKKISFTAVHKAYKSLKSKEENASKCHKTIRKSSKKAFNGPVVNSQESLPKRIRKPNSKYTSMDE